MQTLLQEAQTLFPFTREVRRDLHRHPELGFQEVRTAGVVAKTLRDLGLTVTTGVAKTGVVGLLEGARPGPTVLVRVDMDALPVQEETGAEYASQVPGVMHACGHDGHVAMGLTVARLLAGRRASLAGRVKFVFQPAEEGLGGAEGMVAEGVLEDPRPDVVLGMHLWNERPLGWFGVTDGPAMAAADRLLITVQGKGGHGAAPHLTIDPVVTAAHIVTALQTVAARNIDPLDTAVVSVTRIRAGEAFNVIPPQAELEGTIRTFEPEVRETVLKRVREIAQGVAQAFGAQAGVEVQRLTPPVINDSGVAEQVRALARRLFPEAEISATERTMGSEDFAFFMEDIPGCYFFIGSANEAKGLTYGHHHPRFDFDEEALWRGAALMAGAVLALLGEV
ncbi:MAG TPA: amidohydrolase [Anaerolineae bacterium]|nr:amidohydrolase [Anaerolineae bacterium]HID84213.1 amidohydrolase [Anaerolineales bacterium]HIQ09597.1 amidohydrolase [Anaerolineaceae bacterium]